MAVLRNRRGWMDLVKTARQCTLTWSRIATQIVIIKASPCHFLARCNSLLHYSGVGGSEGEFVASASTRHLLFLNMERAGQPVS